MIIQAGVEGDEQCCRALTCWGSGCGKPADTGLDNFEGQSLSPAGIIVTQELADPVDIKPMLGLLGVLIAAMTSEFNDQVTSVALTDVRGALGHGHDSGTWIQSLYVSAEIVGMAI